MSYVTITKRDFSAPQPADKFRWTVERLDWKAIGGPSLARLRVHAGRGQAGLARLWELAGMLRCGVTVSDDLPAWWGYLSAVELHWGARVVRVSLEDMWNRLGVMYYSYTPTNLNGDRMTTSIIGSAESVGMYGSKERMFSSGKRMTAAQAAAYASTLLGRYGLPVQSSRIEPTTGAGAGAEAAGAEGVTGGDPYAIVECRGWWDTLDWKFYFDERGLLGNLRGNTNYGMGNTSACTKWAESFSPGAEGWTLSDVWLRMRKEGMPADSVRVDICANNAGAPGSSLAYGTTSGWVVGSDMDWVKFVLTTPVTLAAATTYWLVVARTSANDGGAYYQLSVDGASAWTGGALRAWNGVNWISASPEGDMVFQLVGYCDTGLIITRMLDKTLGCGQFLSGVRFEAGSTGSSGMMARDGSTRGRDEVEALLEQGAAGGARLLATIDAARVARVYTQPPAPVAGGQALLVGAAGEIARADGKPLALSEWPAGQWARLGDMAWAFSMLGFSGAVFVEACTWDGQVMRVS
jgi:hypothetical protein